MTRMWKLSVVVGVTVVAAAVLVARGARAEDAAPVKYTRPVKYPMGYRDWTHVKSMLIEKDHPLFDAFGGIHHIYANDKALKAMREGKSFPDGAVFAFDLFEATEANGAVTEGSRKVLGVMERNAKAYAATGGWGFEGFKGDTQDRAVTDALTCFSCHRDQAAKTHFVFSTYRP